MTYQLRDSNRHAPGVSGANGGMRGGMMATIAIGVILVGGSVGWALTHTIRNTASNITPAMESKIAPPATTGTGPPDAKHNRPDQ